MRNLAQSVSSDCLSCQGCFQTSEVDIAFSQRSYISSFITTGHLFSQVTSRNASVLSSDCHFQTIDLTIDQYSTPPTPNRVDYPLSINDTFVSHPRQDLRFL